jgi:hypothetical protein
MTFYLQFYGVAFVPYLLNHLAFLSPNVRHRLNSAPQNPVRFPFPKLYALFPNKELHTTTLLLAPTRLKVHMFRHRPIHEISK